MKNIDKKLNHEEFQRMNEENEHVFYRKNKVVNNTPGNELNEMTVCCWQYKEITNTAEITGVAVILERNVRTIFRKYYNTIHIIWKCTRNFINMIFDIDINFVLDLHG